MERNNGQTIFLSVIGIATLLVAIIGATFAYFTTQVNTESTNGNVNARAMKFGEIKFTAGGFDEDDILPGWAEKKNVKIEWTETDITDDYECNLVITTNDFPNGSLEVKTEAGTSSTELTRDITTATPINGTATIKLAHGTTTNAAGSADFNYIVSFPETASDQTVANQNKAIDAKVSCSVVNKLFYNYVLDNNRNTEPNANDNRTW